MRAKRLLMCAAGAGVTALACAGICWASGDAGHGAPAGGWGATDTYRVMNFVVLAAALYAVLRKPVAKVFSDRIRNIENELKDLETRKVTAEKELVACMDKVANLEAEAAKIVAEYVKQGEAAKSKILSEAKASAEKLEAQAVRTIEQEISAARQALQAELVAQAMVKAEEVIRKQITSEDQDRLVDEYLEKVVA